MKKNIFSLIVLGALLPIGEVLSETSVKESIVTSLSVNKSSLGGLVLINTNKNPQKIPCATNGAWDYTIPLSTNLDNAQYAALLTAYTSKRKVLIVGNGSCDEFPSIESARVVRLLE